MSTQSQYLAILFADISGSTALYDQLGNEVAMRMVTRTLAILTRVALDHQGKLIKTIGDEIMCTFPDAECAVNAARAMQLEVDNLRPGGEHQIHVRIGLHYGEVLLERSDAFGDTVNLAARITAITRARQILTTQAVIRELPEAMLSRTRPIRRTEFRGMAESFEVFQILWEQEDTTSTRIGMQTYRKPTLSRNELLLRYGTKVITLSEQRRSATLGRAEDCDIVIMDNLSSRQHARIEFNFGKFLLTDHSVNGTFVHFSDGQVIELNHQQILLHGGGAISLGRTFEEAGGDVIEYLTQ
ncbi:MAG: adenylate/guanylate cyclase domain-containing protein [Sideroxydans sp.]|nr:adenylate/guanylate cyclase domain-containing protein [Sideroxydans sp.]